MNSAEEEINKVLPSARFCLDALYAWVNKAEEIMEHINERPRQTYSMVNSQSYHFGAQLLIKRRGRVSEKQGNPSMTLFCSTGTQTDKSNHYRQGHTIPENALRKLDPTLIELFRELAFYDHHQMKDRMIPFST